MTSVMIIHNLPDDPPYIPLVNCTKDFRSKVKKITGLLMKEIQNRAIDDNTIMLNMYNILSVNNYANDKFPQLVQEVVTIIEYLVLEKGEDYGQTLLKVIPLAVLSVASILGEQNKVLLSKLPTALINNMITAATHYTALHKNANNWHKGATMQNPQAMITPVGYNNAGQPINMYGQVIQMPQQGVMQYGTVNAYGQPQMTPQQHQQMLANQQQQALALAQQQQAMLAQQQQAMALAQQRQLNAMGGMGNGFPQQTFPQYPQFPQVNGGARTGAFGGQETNQLNVTGGQMAMASSYQPQVAGGPAVAQTAPPPPVQQQVYHAPAAQAVTQQQVPQQQVVAEMAPPPSIAPQPTTGQLNVTSVENGGESWSIANDNTKYRCVGYNNTIVRIPYVYNVCKEKHEVIITNGVAIKQRVVGLGDEVQLSQHETKHYFTARLKTDMGLPVNGQFDKEIMKVLDESLISDISAKLAALNKDDEESLSKETAKIIKAACKGTIRIDKPIVSGVSGNWRYIATNGLNPEYNININKTNIAATCVQILPYQITGNLVSHAQRIMTSSTLDQLHSNFCIFVNEADSVLSSTLVDMVTEFVNTELSKFFGLTISIDSFVLDYTDLMMAIQNKESVEFKQIVSQHLLSRLTTTILYSYTADEINHLCQTEVANRADVRLFAKITDILLIPVRSRDIPYVYNGKSGLLLNTEYPALSRSLDKLLESTNPHTCDLRIVTLDGDAMIVSPILIENSYILYK